VSKDLAQLLFATGASADPGTVVLQPGDDLKSLFGYYQDPTKRPVFSTLPLNATPAQRQAYAAQERAQFDLSRQNNIEFLKNWIAHQQGIRGVYPMPRRVPESYHDRWNQIVEQQNMLDDAGSQMDDLLGMRKITQGQYDILDKEFERWNEGVNAQIRTLHSDLLRNEKQELNVLKGKRHI